jgi:Endonuclease/Exonuclease/phosphatase family
VPLTTRSIGCTKEMTRRGADPEGPSGQRHCNPVRSARMRIVTWNCCSDGARKWGWVEQLGADVAVICEGSRRSPRPSPSLFEPAVAWHAAGSLEHKHVAIGSSRLDLEALEARDGQGQWAVAVRLGGGPEILGVWSRPPRPSGATYATSVVSTLRAWADQLARGRMLVAGDFNVGFPIGRDGGSLYAKRVARAWEAIGLVSVYHSYFEVEMGHESRATFFDKRRRTLGWHIDYVLVHRDLAHRIRNVEVGDFWEWVLTGRSDHVPLIVDIDW